jgi:hypothetical protein
MLLTIARLRSLALLSITGMETRFTFGPVSQVPLFYESWSLATSNEALIPHRLIECIRGDPRAPFWGGLVSSMLLFVWLFTALLH